MFNIGPGELLAILGLALIVLGPSRLPDALRATGRVVGQVRRITSSLQAELTAALDAPTEDDDAPDAEVDAEDDEVDEDDEAPDEAA